MSDVIDKSKAQKVAEGEVDSFRKRLGPFVIAAETTRMAMLFTDAKELHHPIIFANDSFLSLTGYDREEVLGQSFSGLMGRGTDRVVTTKLEAAFEDSAAHDPEMRCRRKNGREFWVSVYVCPVADASGKTVQHFVSLVDLTEHKQEQARSEILINELNHRVKNTLSTVQAIVRMALQGATDPQAIRTSIESRLIALSRSHDLLTREGWVDVSLFDLVNAALSPFALGNGRAPRATVTGEDIRLTPREALALGIALHELATNAVKFGALSNQAGTVAVAWALNLTPQGQRRLVLRWQEKNGPTVAPPSRKGFGSQVIASGLAHELEASVHLDYRPSGLVCAIDMPTTRDTVD
jgi:PAS domain S-box-containing protein